MLLPPNRLAGFPSAGSPVGDCVRNVKRSLQLAAKELIQGKEVPTGGISSYFKAKKIANLLKERITQGDFLLTEPVTSLPDSESGYAFRPMNERPIEK